MKFPSTPLQNILVWIAQNLVTKNINMHGYKLKQMRLNARSCEHGWAETRVSHSAIGHLRLFAYCILLILLWYLYITEQTGGSIRIWN